LGIDDPVTFDEMVSLVTDYHGGAYTYEQVESDFTVLNNLLLSYPATYSGGSQFLADSDSDGTNTVKQHAVLESEINALLNATTEAEILAIINTVSNELYASQFPPNDTEVITRINAGIEEMVDAQIAMIPSTQDNDYMFHKTGGTVALIGLALVAVGYIRYSVSEYN